MSTLELTSKIESLPEELKEEVNDFIDFLAEKKVKKKKKFPLGKRTAGLAKGKIKLLPDFDDPLEEFKEYM